MIRNHDKELGYFLANERNKKGRSQEEIAKEFCITKQGYAKKEKGLVGWKLECLGIASRLFDLDFRIKNDVLNIFKGDGIMIKTMKLDKKENDVSIIKELDGDIAIIKLYSNSEYGCYGNIHTSLEDVLSERDEAIAIDKTSRLMEGYGLYDTRLGYTPSDARDWHDTFESAEEEYSMREVSKTNFNKENIRKDFIEFVAENIEDMAMCHIDAWKDRYWGKSLKAISFDLWVSNDLSPEREYIEDELGLGLNDDENMYLKFRFIKQVLYLFEYGFKHLI